MYGQIKNGTLIYAPNSIIKNGKRIYNPQHEHLLASGYKPVITSEYPQGGKHYKQTYKETETEIYTVWVYNEEEQKKAEALEKHRPLTEAEVGAMVIRHQINTLAVDDNTAFRMKNFYPNFTQIIGQTVKQGFKFTHGEKLYKTIQAELTIAAHYPPGAGTESLYAEICEKHDGSKYDPIPYSGNMALENGKYYIENAVFYRCIRDTVNPVYNHLADLVGVYVEIV
jgi:hypothetical protein